MATPQIPRRFQPLLDQASAEAQVRYTPLLQAINQAAADAHGSYLSDVGQAHAAGDLLANTARSSLAEISNPSNPLTQLAQQYQGAPGVTSTIANNLGLTAGSLQSMLAQREAQAGPTQVFQIQNAQAKRDQTLAGLSGKAQDLQGQIGQYITGRYDSLVGADRKQRHDANQAAAKIAAQQTMTNARLAVTARGQDLSHQDRQASIQQRTDAARAKAQAKNGPKLLSPQAHTKFQNDVASALATVSQMKASGRSRSEIAQALLTGRPAMTIQLGPGDQGYDPKKTPAQNTAHPPALPKVPDLVLKIALDRTFNPGGHISPGYVNLLHKAGYSVRKLGFPTKGPAPGVQAAVKAVQQIGL